MADSSSPSSAPPDLTASVESAANLPSGPQRDAALIEALRKCRKELDDAECECKAAQSRVSAAKDKFDALAMMIARVDASTQPTTSTSANPIIADGGGGATSGKRGEAPSPISNRQSNKLPKQSSPSSPSPEDGGLDIPAPPIPTNIIHVPPQYTYYYYSIAPSEQVKTNTHRENFYRKLLGIPASEIENYTPPPTQANLRSKSQLVEGIYIARHWETGDEELDAAAFRSRHKTWYSKMKPMTRDVGRRTGIHIRTLASSIPNSSSSSTSQAEGETVLCRYNKDGTKSILYIDVTQLFDALFEIHSLEQNHHVRGSSALKARVDELYANITDGHVKTFLDTCPVCIERRGRPPTTTGIGLEV